MPETMDPTRPDATIPPAVEPGGERRKQPDRRNAPTGPWDALPPAGRRMRARRADEHRRNYFVDRFPAMTLAVILVVCLASLLDAVLTIHLLENGCAEANPVMDLLLQHGVAAFLIGKYLLTVVGLPLLLVFKNFHLFGTRLRVGHLLPAVVVVYFVLLLYQCRLMGLCLD